MSRLLLKEELKEAAELLKDGGVLLHRADTIWGLICDATSEKGVEALSKIKARPKGKSYVILVNNEAMLERFVSEIPDVAWDIIDSAVDPLTVIYPQGRGLANGVCAEDGSIGVRVVNDSLTQKLIQILKKPIVSSSANLTGFATPVTLAEISRSISDNVTGTIRYEGIDKGTAKASSIIKLGLKGEVHVIRS